MSSQLVHTIWVGLQDQCAAAVIVGGITSVLGCFAICGALLGSYLVQGMQAKWALLTPRAAGLRTSRRAVR